MGSPGRIESGIQARKWEVFWIHRRSKLEHKELTSDTLSPASFFFQQKQHLCSDCTVFISCFVPKFCQVNDGGTWSYVNLGSEKSQELMPGDTEGCLQKTTLRKFSSMSNITTISGIFLTKSLSLTNHRFLTNSQSLILEAHWPRNMSIDIAIQLLVQKFTQWTPKNPGC